MSLILCIRRIAILSLLIGITACGRAGPLEAPSATVTAPAVETPETTKEDKPFILDGLL